MASAFSHAFVAAAIGAVCLPRKTPPAVWIAGMACAVAPDLDVVAFRFGVPYQSVFGHRGLSHSLLIATVVAAVLTPILRRFSAATLPSMRLAIFLFAATASHGVLDALTNGGLGVAFFAPFENSRYFFPWRPVQVSPIGIREFFSAEGAAVLRSELIWLGLPSLLIVAAVTAARRLWR